MKELGIDIETYSATSLSDCGVYRYAQDPSFKVLLFYYSIDGGEVKGVDLARGEELPGEIRDALLDPNVRKTAFNATFERVCLSRHLQDGGSWSGGYLPPEQWDCTMVAAARAGLPLSLAQCGEVLGLDEKGEGKMKEGKALIRLFSLPNKKGERVTPDERPEEWDTFKEYCKRDVEVEQAIRKAVTRFSVPLWEPRLYSIDQRINDRGVKIERKLVENADRLNDEYMGELRQKAKELTGLDNPNSPAQLKAWLAEKGVKSDTLRKADLARMIPNATPIVAKVLRIRQELGKTSNKKYGTMLDCVCEDGRVRGLLQYYGAARTGRWAGRLVQLQNLPQNHIADIDDARRLAMSGDLDEFSLSYANVTQTLSELIRTALVAEDGHTFHVCDFSAIEARVIAWVAGEEWVLEVFRNGGDIYCATASQMFGVEVGKHGPNAELRKYGKISVLALGYGGGINALVAFGADKMGMSTDDQWSTVRKWRAANPNIVRLWSNVERAAIKALTEDTAVRINRGITFRKEFGCLTVELPSGRKLVYPRAKVKEIMKTFGGTTEELSTAIVYEGMNQQTKKWGEVETYGGKMVENIVQAIARDILGMVLLRAENKRMKVVFHVHDEIIVEADENTTLGQVEEIFDEPVGWANGLPLKGAGYTTPYYMKD